MVFFEYWHFFSLFLVGGLALIASFALHLRMSFIITTPFLALSVDFSIDDKTAMLSY